MIANRSGSFTKTKRFWLWVVLIVAVVLASSPVAAASTKADSVGRRDFPPTPVLMKGKTELQKGHYVSSTWHYYEDGWITSFGDGVYLFPRAESVKAGTTLHIRSTKNQKPESFRITAYKGINEMGFPIGEGQRLNTTLKRVERDGKAVAWDVFFHVNKPERHYYLETYARWERVLGTHISYGDGFWTFHVKTEALEN
jgi:hypothetical protein